MTSSEYRFCRKLNTTAIKVNPPPPGLLSLTLGKIPHIYPQQNKTKQTKKSDTHTIRAIKALFSFSRQVNREGCLTSTQLVQLVKWKISTCIHSFSIFFFQGFSFTTCIISKL